MVVRRSVRHTRSLGGGRKKTRSLRGGRKKTKKTKSIKRTKRSRVKRKRKSKSNRDFALQSAPARASEPQNNSAAAANNSGSEAITKNSGLDGERPDINDPRTAAELDIDVVLAEMRWIIENRYASRTMNEGFRNRYEEYMDIDSPYNKILEELRKKINE